MQKHLTKSRDKILAGVFGGIAEYFGWDKAWTRIGGTILICCTGFGLIAYIAAAIVMPDKPNPSDTPEGDFHKL